MSNYLIPYGIVLLVKKFSLKAVIKFFIPPGIWELLLNRRKKTFFTADYLKKNFVSDLTDQEKYLLLAYLKYFEKKQQGVRYLEIGIYAGSTIRFLKERTLVCDFTGVDLFEDFKIDEANTHLWQNFTHSVVEESLGKERVRILKGDSSDVLQKLRTVNEKFDFIFIDGNHTYEATKKDFELASFILEPRGLIAFHNASTGFSQEDKYYIERDGGPWTVYKEAIDSGEYALLDSVDRIKIIKRSDFTL